MGSLTTFSESSVLGGMGSTESIRARHHLFPNPTLPTGAIWNWAGKGFGSLCCRFPWDSDARPQIWRWDQTVHISLNRNSCVLEQLDDFSPEHRSEEKPQRVG